MGEMVSSKEPLRVAILGCGFMGTALLKGILKRQTNTSQLQVQLAACVRSTESVARIQSSLGEQAGQVTLGSGNDFAVQITEQAQVVILGVQLGDLSELLKIPDLAQALAPRIVVSMIAGENLRGLERRFDGKVRLKYLRSLKVMPTIGAQNGDSISLLAYPPDAAPEDVKLVKDLFGLVGSVTDVQEKLIGSGVGLSATCHALALAAMDSITDAGVAEGLPRQLAATLARSSLQSALGVLENGMSVEQLKEAVSTPNGITLNSVVRFEKGVRGGIVENTQKTIDHARYM